MPEPQTESVAFGEHEYVPTSNWTGTALFPRWAVCRGCGFRGPERSTWAAAERDYDDHLTSPGLTEGGDDRG